MSQPILADSSSFKYTDSESELSFTVPENWEEVDFVGNESDLTAKFKPKCNSRASIIYTSSDIWSTISNSEKSMLSRNDYDTSVLTLNDAKQLFEQIADSQNLEVEYVKKVEYNKKDFYECTMSGFYDEDFVCLLFLDNGWAYQLQFYGEKDSIYYDDFLSLAKSIEYPEIFDFSPLRNFLFLIATIIIHSVPIIIYRYLIRKRPLTQKAAKKITFIYGAFMFVVVCLAVSYMYDEFSPAKIAPLIFWNIVNYKILTLGNTCPNCGTKFKQYTFCCLNCGTKIEH